MHAVVSSSRRTPETFSPGSPERRRLPVVARALPLLAVPLIVERIALLMRRTPTASDETLYLTQTYDWLGRLTKVSFDPHRTRGVPALLYPFVAVTHGTWAYRTVWAVMSLALCAVTYLIGRDLLGRVPAAFAAVMLGLSSVTLLASIRLLPDMPAALSIALAFLFYWRRVVRVPAGEPLRGLWPIALFVAAAFFFNMAFAAVAGLALGLDFLIFRRRDVLSRAAIGAAATLAAVLGPYFAKVWIDHGTPLYTIGRGLGLGGSGAPQEKGYATYARWFLNGDRLFGPFWGALVLVGAASLIAALMSGRPVPRRQAATLTVWLVVPTVMTAVLFHAEGRYLLPWLPAFFLTLALPVRVALRAASTRRWATVCIAVLLIGGTAQFGVAGYAPAMKRIGRQNAIFGFIHAVAARTADDGARLRCQIFTRWPREFEFHTGCKTLRYNGVTADGLLRKARESAVPTYFVWWHGLTRDPAYQPPYLPEFYRRHAAPLFTMRGGGELGPVYVYRYVGRISR